jgi:Membrane protein putatively involved in post-translational modification of the autoinducing quorum-sensing peptide
MKVNILSNLICKQIACFEKYGLVIDTPSKRDAYTYGLIVIYTYIIDIVILFSGALFFGRLYETVIMTFLFGLLQVLGGGYHAKTPLMCLFWMAIGVVIGNLMIVSLIPNSVVTLVLVGVALLIAFCLVPQTNAKHPVSRRTRLRSLWVARLILIGLLVGMMILFALGMKSEFTIIAVTLYLYTVSIVFAKIKNMSV